MHRINKFLDFDKNKEVFYNNLYLNDEKIVVKMPIHLNGNGYGIHENNGNGVKLDAFDLTKYTYLVSYD
ncbi:MAG: hypothetical protein GF311_27680 [Candidatus Lokiarchaeota archaeon]|nr:hypothetical protein [Candidatus Lokiarchaeota archaeon]